MARRAESSEPKYLIRKNHSVVNPKQLSIQTHGKLSGQTEECKLQPEALYSGVKFYWLPVSPDKHATSSCSTNNQPAGSEVKAKLHRADKLFTALGSPHNAIKNKTVGISDCQFPLCIQDFCCIIAEPSGVGGV